MLWKRKFKFYLFDVNKNTKRYISDLLISKHFKFNEIALSNKSGMAEFNYNSFFFQVTGVISLTISRGK